MKNNILLILIFCFFRVVSYASVSGEKISYSQFSEADTDIAEDSSQSFYSSQYSDSSSSGPKKKRLRSSLSPHGKTIFSPGGTFVLKITPQTIGKKNIVYIMTPGGTALPRFSLRNEPLSAAGLIRLICYIESSLVISGHRYIGRTVSADKRSSAHARTISTRGETPKACLYGNTPHYQGLISDIHDSQIALIEGLMILLAEADIKNNSDTGLNIQQASKEAKDFLDNFYDFIKTEPGLSIASNADSETWEFEYTNELDKDGLKYIEKSTKKLAFPKFNPDDSEDEDEDES